MSSTKPVTGVKRKRPADLESANLASAEAVVEASSSSAEAVKPVVAAPEVVKAAIDSVAARGVSTSHRTWKAVETKRFSAITRPRAPPPAKKGVKSTAFKLQQANQAARKAAMAIQLRLKEARDVEKKERAEKMAEKRRRKAENEFKSATYQEMSDPAKLKKMSKKQLRGVKRVRINDEGVPEFAAAYS